MITGRQTLFGLTDATAVTAVRHRIPGPGASSAELAFQLRYALK